jgi:hypothetical protein
MYHLAAADGCWTCCTVAAAKELGTAGGFKMLLLAGQVWQVSSSRLRVGELGVRHQGHRLKQLPSTTAKPQPCARPSCVMLAQ